MFAGKPAMAEAARENLLKILATAPAAIAEEIIQLEGVESTIAVASTPKKQKKKFCCCKAKRIC